MDTEKTFYVAAASLMLILLIYLGYWMTPIINSPDCVTPLGPQTVKIELIGGKYVDLHCDASDIKVYMKRWGFEHATTETDHQVWVR
jgi:hypothetical protein